MLPCHSCCGTWRSKEVGVFQSYHTEGRGKATNKKNFYGAP